MKHTTVNLTKQSLETLERYYPSSMPTSAKICAVITEWINDGRPNVMYYRERANQKYLRIRVHLPDHLTQQIPEGINLSHTIRTYLQSFI